MNIFRKKEVKKPCCGGDCTPKAMGNAEILKKEKGIKILGSGCAKCQALEKATREAMEELGIQTTLLHVSDYAQIASYGVMSTPALVVDERVVSYGKVLTSEEVKNLLSKMFL